MNKVKTFKIGHFEVGGENFTLIAGPCLAESLDLCREVASNLLPIAEKLGINLIFKASFDKANRTSVNSNRGQGIDEGLKILADIKAEFGLSVTTDVHLPSQVETVAYVVDLLQVPAFLCRQTDLLEACAQSGKPVNVKKGQFLAPWDVSNIVEKLEAYQSTGILLTERGTTFGYNMLVVDMAGLETMRNLGHPICFDATHSAQRPGGAGTSTGGNRDSIPAMARAAAAVGIDALFCEVHPDPEKAWSDAATQWPLDKAEKLLAQVVEIHNLRKSF